VREHGRLGPIEWARAGRPLPSEYTSGDRGIAVDIDGEAALFGVVDGLGHGPDAAAAALRAVETLNTARDKRLEVLIQLCHRVLEGTRGAAMTVARVDFAASTLSWIGVGNVTGELVAKAPTGINVRVMATDGIAEEYLENIDFSASALVIAEEILSKYARETDDAMVLTARHRGATT
jgi:hypothetical protein